MTSFACKSDSLFFYWITDHLNGLTLILSCRHGWGRWSVRNTRAGFKWHDESRLLQRIPGFSCTSNQVSWFCSRPHYYERSANKMTDATNCLVQGRSWCSWILRVVILGQLWVGYGLHQEVWHCLWTTRMGSPGTPKHQPCGSHASWRVRLPKTKLIQTEQTARGK